MDDRYTEYLNKVGIVPKEELEPLLSQVDSSYYNKFKTSEWSFVVPSDEEHLYSPLIFPDNIFLNEMLNGSKDSKADSLSLDNIGIEIENSILSSTVEHSEDFKFILIGNVIHIKNVSYDRTIRVKGVYVEKIYDNIPFELKSILNMILYNLDLLEPQGLYYSMGKLSTWKKDKLAEKIPRRKRVSGNSINIPRRPLR